MKIKNVSTGIVAINDIPGANGNLGLTIQGQAEVLIFDEDAEKSAELASLMASGLITKLSGEEPLDAGAAADGTGDAAAASAAAAVADGKAVTAQATADAALPKAGGTMTGAIAMGGFGVTGLPAPVLASDAARKDEVDLKAAKTTAAVEADALATVVVAVGPASAAYVQAEVQAVADLANDLKAKYDAAILLINELKAKLNTMNA